MATFFLFLYTTYLTMASPTVVDTPGLGYTDAVASHALSSQTHAQLVTEPRTGQSPTENLAAGDGAHIGFIVNRNSVPINMTEIADEYLFRLSIEEFEAKRDSRYPPTLDWSSDGCTKAPDDIGTWNFLPACHRHDFGIRNYRKQGRLNKPTKRQIDNQFLKE